jgi:carbamoyltransferase
MIILGMNFSHDGAVALVKDGRLISSIATERITREKKAVGVTKSVVDAILGEAGLVPQDVDAIALADYKEPNSHNVLTLWDANRTQVQRTDYTLYENDVRVLQGVFLGLERPVYVLPHHLAHASSSYYSSNFSRAVCLSVDSSFGELGDNSGVFQGSGTKLIWKECPNLISGIGYAVFTELLGFKPAYSKAGTTMGLSSYGRSLLKQEFDKIVDEMFFVAKEHAELEYRIFWSNMWEKLIAKHPHELTFTESADLAATVQKLLEKSLVKTVQSISQTYPEKNLCLSGGSMLNCISNSEIKKQTLFDAIHHFPACGDDGNAVGSALYVAHHLFDAPRAHYTTGDIAYLGPSQATTTPDYERVCSILESGGIVAWHMGRSEYGPRALGARSLLADPRSSHTRERINFAVKNREWFRPIAPIVLEEHASEWFDLKIPSPYMLYTCQVLKPKEIPAVSHVDGSSRPQTVDQNSNPHLRTLLETWYKRTGVPVLVNTSLNGGGEPLCESEEDSLRFFETTDSVAALVLNGKLLERNL